MPPFDKAKYSQPLDILKGKKEKHMRRGERKKNSRVKNLCHVPVSRRIRERLCALGDGARLSSVVQVR